MEALTAELCNTGNPPEIRQQAGIQLKNCLETRNEDETERRLQAWRQFPQAMKLGIKQKVSEKARVAACTGFPVNPVVESEWFLFAIQHVSLWGGWGQVTIRNGGECTLDRLVPIVKFKTEYFILFFSARSSCFAFVCPPSSQVLACLGTEAQTQSSAALVISAIAQAEIPARNAEGVLVNEW
jgi:hypothetical protein